MENLFTDRDNYSANFGTELAKSSGASSPDFKVFIEPKSFAVDTVANWNLGTFNNVISGTLGTFGTNGNVQIESNTSFNGLNSVINFGTWFNESGTNGLTIEGWIRSGTSPANGGCIIGREFYNSSVDNGGILISVLPSGEIQIDFRNNAVNNVNSTIKVNNFQWTHFCAVFNPSVNQKIFINGTLDGSGIAGTGIIYGTYTLNLGDFPRYDARFNGLMRDIRIYNRVLGTSEILDRIQNNTNITNGLINWWKLNEGAGTIFADSKGTLTGTSSNITFVLAQNGTYTSKIYDSGFHSNFKQLNMTELLNNGTTVYQFRTGTSQADCDNASWKAVVSGTRPNIPDGEFYQFRIALTGDGTTSPVVDKVTGTTQYNLSDRLITTPEISRSLERLFQETQISSVGLNLDNTDGVFNPLGTGLYSVSSVYNKAVEIWKGFKYGWNGSSWGTGEYIPAWAGFIDNIQIDGNGRAVLNARDKGKLFFNNTSEKCTQTGTAGGAYWHNERIDENVEHLLQQSVNYGIVGTNYNIDPAYLISQTNTKEISTIGNDVVLNSLFVVGTSVVVLNNSGAYFYNGKGTTSYIGTFNNGVMTDGTFIYNSALYKYNPFNNAGTIISGTTSVTGANLLYLTANNSVYFNIGTLIHYINSNGGTIGTVGTAVYSYAETIVAIYKDEQALSNGTHLFVVNANVGLGETKGTYNVKAISVITNTHFGDGQVKLDSTNIPGTTARLSLGAFHLGTIFMETNIYPGGALYVGLPTGTAFNVEYALAGNFAVSSGAIYTGGTSFLKRKYYSQLDNKLYYTSGGTLWSLNGTTNTMIDTTSIGEGVDASFMGEIGTTDLPERLFLFNKSSGTVFEQYSSMYFFTIGTFDVGNGDTVADVLQTLAEASNYVQYIDEGGVYYFRRRDSGTTIDYTFGTNDIVSITAQEGEGVSQSPIYNKGIWGTNTGTVSYEDLPSQGTYGIQTYNLNNKWIVTPAIANDTLYNFVDNNKQPKVVITTRLRYYPVVKLFDVVGLDLPQLSLSGTKPFQVIGLSENNNSTTITLKEV